MFVLAPRFKDLATFSQVAPLEDLNGHMADAPGIHGLAAGLIEINGVSAREHPAVVIDHKNLSSFDDTEFCAHWPS